MIVMHVRHSTSALYCTVLYEYCTYFNVWGTYLSIHLSIYHIYLPGWEFLRQKAKTDLFGLVLTMSAGRMRRG